ncbi:N-acetyltransferase [Synechococcus sp. UW140]|uniref:N-acetyltransferase n=1 Tax=Synechococcus sp. UW140 TaxID=368503 RepID=UPI000E0FE6F2|nr:N-acetyltransferase [Synechococcus sp. UW140]
MAFLPFRQQPAEPKLPEGFELFSDLKPEAEAINRLLAACEEPTPPSERWQAALEQSLWHLCILDVSTSELVGFVRVTSDRALNANLWNLAARPGPMQAQLLAVLVHRALSGLRKQLPGCSISIAAPPAALDALKKQGFVLDPGGIRAMGLRLR